ncbi:DUF2069 domain-containing protein [Rhodocyclus tenuis]|uniref:DUF2069 domain-containing protein n=2 Tax=Rhodocyclus TaxID=1064 RepID=A0A6L5JWE7_RHOTE|nr:DUF2069 domain-containing protein [Rhodocyclus gracilis]MQY51675.1 DUF2069 domain-containing protein [Rhodocyclus gracilis]MRD73156.1 DUF2069 domain-containing protein [Rhodocyclus gracilis]NJA89064.1 DUF2069 domain-containing protein [Rhodocyclus gracilis]
MIRLALRASAASLIALIFLCLAWELRLAPVQAGGSWLALKCVPLLIPLRGILTGRRYTYQWASMLILAYFTEGIVRAMSDHGLSQVLAGIETALCLIFFVGSVAFAYYSRPSAQAAAEPPAADA